jgi:hypothetical protein
MKQNEETNMQREFLSSFDIASEDKQWLRDQAFKELSSINSVLRKIIRQARERDEKRAAKK